VDSTNRVVLDAAKEGAAEGLVVVADRQTAGRGRQGRTWSSEAGDGLLLSILRRPRVPAVQGWLWTPLAGVAALEALRPWLPGAWLKWPNDLMWDSRKLGGILCELSTIVDRVDALVVGLGINLRSPRAGWPVDLARRATSLAEAMGEGNEELSGATRCVPPKETVLSALLSRLAAREANLFESGPAPLLAAWRTALAPMFGRELRVELGDSTLRAAATGVADDGALLLVDDNGRALRVVAGDVHLGVL
jgi:BirA family biotin operon repressor/biotin-[acetyl-CoA-carboxylase] ligase